MADHGGEITYESQEGKGTIFTVVFPTALRENPAHILVADDEETLRKIIVQALTKERNYVVEQASNGKEVLLKMGIIRPDLLILDIFMPDMDGLDVCRAIRNAPELAKTKVIIITGRPDNPKVKEVIGLGFTDIYPKPLDLADFVAEMDHHLKNGTYTR